MKNLHSFFLLHLALSVVFGLGVGHAAAGLPNILILYADDLGFGDLSVQNPNSKIPTPNLDRLARSGMRFTDGHSSSGICTPSRYAMLTGRHHWRDFNGIAQSFTPSVFKPGQMTMADMLRTKGYRTAAIGKWHLGMGWDGIRNGAVKPKGENGLPPEAFDWSRPIPDSPLAHGFDTYFGDDVINFPPYGWIENDLMVKAPDVMMDTSKWKPIKEGNWECRPGPMVSGWDPYQVLPTLTQRAVDLIKAESKTDVPFFLYFAFPSPHAPIIPNDEFDGKSKAGAYGDFVVETDDCAGRILAALAESGQEENTIVIFSADNGPEKYAYERDAKHDHWSAAPLRGLKRDVYEGGHHVPFIVRWPGVTEAGLVSPALVSQVDIMATLAAVVEFDLPDDQAADSHDLVPLLKGKVESVRTSHVHNTFKDEYAIRDGDWVLVNATKKSKHAGNRKWEQKHGYPEGGREVAELYNLREDIGQRHNVAGEHPERVEAMVKLLRKSIADGHTAPRLAEIGNDGL